MKLIARIGIFISAISILMPAAANEHRTVNIKLAYTTDVHGNFFPFNFITLSPWSGSMARVATAVDSLRHSFGKENVILLDNGDILQGQPTVYYYNYIDTVSPHIVPEIYSFMGYDAATIGNHDVETGHSVYDRWIAQSSIPVLGANVIDTATGQPYLKPYTIIERNGVKIAILGLLTPAIPAWLPETLWSGLEFEDMETAARHWIPIIKERDNPHVIVGMFHSGHDASRMTGIYKENASKAVAQNVDGFDIILMGHDHQRYHEVVTSPDGHKVTVINPANNANALGLADLCITFDEHGNMTGKDVSATLVDISNIEPSEEYLETFSTQSEKILEFVSRPIGYATDTLSTRDAFFGPSSFMTLLHKLQLQISGADISFAAPLSFDAVIAKGDVKVSDMFTLYKYENMLYVMELTGQEIKDYLEESYSLWTRQITDTNKHLIDFAAENPDKKNNRLRNPSYNFDSAAGIRYTVDVTKPKGEKINIISMESGEPFDLHKTYRVAVNSYRGNGGGDHLTKGAGINADELKKRIVSATDKDLRYYLLKEIERNGTIRPEVADNWKFIPATIANQAITKDRELLFSPDSSKEQK